MSNDLTKREVVALHALTGLIAARPDLSMETNRKEAFSVADAFLAESAKGPPKSLPQSLAIARESLNEPATFGGAEWDGSTIWTTEMLAAPRDGRKVWVKRVHEGALISEGWAVWGQFRVGAPYLLAGGDNEERWMQPDCLRAFPEPTHWEKVRTRLERQRLTAPCQHPESYWVEEVHGCGRQHCPACGLDWYDGQASPKGWFSTRATDDDMAEGVSFQPRPPAPVAAPNPIPDRTYVVNGKPVTLADIDAAAGKIRSCMSFREIVRAVLEHFGFKLPEEPAA